MADVRATVARQDRRMGRARRCTARDRRGRGCSRCAARTDAAGNSARAFGRGSVDLGKSRHRPPLAESPDAPEDYCRAIEAYLCRKNDGHLIRIVGPSFEMVCGWAARGVPVSAAQRGIDRYFERYYAKGPRRRPVRIDFCEADVLDVFDEWRRAVGVTVAPDESVAAVRHE